LRRALLAVLLLSGCAQILGLEDKELADAGAGVGNKDAGAGSVVDPDSGIVTTSDCENYCTLANRLCTADAGVLLFRSYETCLSVCNKYPTGPSLEGDTLACRLNLLRGLDRTGPNEAASTCPGAGPGGGPPPGELNGSHCGTNCEGFCKLRAATCPPTEGDVNCEAKCSALVDETTFNAGNDFTGGQDNLSCRLAHLSAAALYGTTDPVNDAGTIPNRDTHCSHSGIRSESQCDFKDNLPPDCESYCKIVQNACTADKAVYESKEQCLLVCGHMQPGMSANTTAVGSKRCYRAGAYDALAGQSNGCPRASIAGDGCLGGRCASYCYFAQEACPDAFKDAYPTGTQGECTAACNALSGSPTGSAYSLSLDLANSGNNLICRLKQLTRALASSTGAANCKAALGLDDPCK
jgi:hypothetical protein